MLYLPKEKSRGNTGHTMGLVLLSNIYVVSLFFFPTVLLRLLERELLKLLAHATDMNIVPLIPISSGTSLLFSHHPFQ